MSDRINVRTLLEQKGQLADDVVAIKVDGKLVDLHSSVDPTATFELVRDDGQGRPAGHPSLDGARHGGRRPAALPGHEGHHRSRDRGRLLLRLRQAGRRLHRGRPREDREGDARDRRRATRPSVARSSRATRRIALFEKMGETFKVEIIESIPEGEEISLYKHGTHEKSRTTRTTGSTSARARTCRAPSHLGAVKLTSVAGAYWRGDERNPMLQRIYGTAFPTQGGARRAPEAHRGGEGARPPQARQGARALHLRHESRRRCRSSCRAARSSTTRSSSYMRELYVDARLRRGRSRRRSSTRSCSGRAATSATTTRTCTASGREDLLEDAHAPRTRTATTSPTARRSSSSCRTTRSRIKPMNCPSHCVIFGSRRRSYRELPWRMADFGRLHRYERGGVVHGLVARAHASARTTRTSSARREQVAGEIEKFMKLLLPGLQGLRLRARSTSSSRRAPRSASAPTSTGTWPRARSQKGLERAGLPFEILPGEGAFYGPKIEFHVQDALKRSWQLGTIQYDPNLPERFELDYVGEDGKEHRPVMLHRAIFGSLERFFSVYIEHCGGNFPAWLAPDAGDGPHGERQERGLRPRRARAPQGARASASRPTSRGDKLGAKIRNARTARHPYMLVVGDEGRRGRHRLRPLARQGRARRDAVRSVHGDAHRREPPSAVARSTEAVWGSSATRGRRRAFAARGCPS